MPIFTAETGMRPADVDTAFDVTLAVAGTAEDLVTVLASKFGRIISLVNRGPGEAALAFDATATVADVKLKVGEAYAESGLEITTKVSFINVTVGKQPRVQGVLWSGD